jgi:hypothetical protein
MTGVTMPKQRTKDSKPTAADADLILKLYDLRREAEMRKARDFITSFSPQSFEDIKKVALAYPSPENNWLRQVAGYWEMAASLVNHGTLHYELFVENNPEMFAFFCRFRPFLKEMREFFQAPELLANVEKVIMATPQSRERLRQMEARMAMRKQMMAQASVARTA